MSGIADDPIEAQTPQLHLSTFLLQVRKYESTEGFGALVEAYFSNKTGGHVNKQNTFRDIYLERRVCVLKAAYELFTKSSPVSSSKEAFQDFTEVGVCPTNLHQIELQGRSTGNPRSDRSNSLQLSNNSQRRHLEVFVKQRLHLLRKYNIRRVTDDIIDVAFMGLKSRLELFVNTVVTISGSHGACARISRKVSSPRQSVRQLNAGVEERQNLRCAEERKALILASETLKRGRSAPDDDDQLKEKVTKVLQEEEDRARAIAANEAARSALGGDAKYLRWSLKNSQSKQSTTEPERERTLTCLPEPLIPKAQEILKRSITLTDVFLAMHREAPVRTSSMRRKQQYLAQVKMNSSIN
jgi:hypothetical protein